MPSNLLLSRVKCIQLLEKLKLQFTSIFPSNYIMSHHIIVYGSHIISLKVNELNRSDKKKSTRTATKYETLFFPLE